MNFPHASKAFKAKNPHLFGSNLGALDRDQRKPSQVSPLDRGHATRQSRKNRLGICVEITAFRRRLLDNDNLIAGCKALRDAIAHSLGLDDGDPRIDWQYRQVVTSQEPGTLVRVSLYE